MKKKFIILLLLCISCLMFTFGLTACDGSKTDNSSKTPPLNATGTAVEIEGFTREENNFFKKVPNDTSIFTFINAVSVSEGAEWRLYYDVACRNEIVSKADELRIGDNTFYILVTNGDALSLYPVTVHRRLTYTVQFNTMGGTPVTTQIVEEDSCATQPHTERAGYTFTGWTYDFTTPIGKNETVTATWKANEYTITYLENGGDKLAEPTRTVIYGTHYTLSVPVREEYAFLGWFYGETQLTNAYGESLSAYHLAHDAVLSAGWKVVGYDFECENESFEMGKITATPNGAYLSGTEISLQASPHLGYTFVGWFEGEILLSEEATYTFNLPKRNISVVAKWNVIEEMKPFIFISNHTLCTINGLQDSSISQITIPNYVTTIGDSAFKECSRLTSLTISDSVTSIGASAFYNCSALTSINIPDSVTSIGASAFYHCGLTSIAIPYGITSIQDRTFYNCDGITSITIPDSVTSIGDEAFSWCRKLTSVTIPDSVTSIGNSAFYNALLLERINFQGTTAQWIAIEKGYNWNKTTTGNASTIYCIDGTVSPSGKATKY